MTIRDADAPNSPINDCLPSDRFRSATAAGLRVFPVLPRGKQPALKWSEFRDREPTPAELAAWDASDDNVGVVCGGSGGIVVVDVDSPEAQQFVDDLDLPRTPYVRTARGTHYYYQAPAGAVRNAAKIMGHKLDLRGDGGYVVGAGSIHESGACYRWVIAPSEMPFAPIPQQLLDLLEVPKRVTPPGRVVARDVEPGDVGKFDNYLSKRLAEAKAELAVKAEGDRNDSLFRVGVSLARDVCGAAADWAPFAAELTRVALEIGLEVEESGRTLESCLRAGAEEPARWMVTAREWLYLGKHDVLHHLASGQHVKREAFNNTFASQRVAKGPFSAFLLNNDYITKVHDLDYQPQQLDRLLERDGLKWFNTYRPSNVERAEGDPEPFIDFLAYLVPNEEECEHLLKMIAWTVRNPGRKLRHALLLRSEHQGIGKSMLTEIWGDLLGRHNVRKTTTEEVSGAYQGYIKETLLIVLEELNWGVGPTGYNRLKDLITGDVATVNEKYMAVRHWPNFASFVILTNLPTPMIIEDKDRRIFYIDTPARPRDAAYYSAFAAWWQANLGVIRAYLDTIDLTSFDPFANAPTTAAKLALIADGRADLVKDLALAIEGRWGVFDRDIVTLDEIEAELGSSMRGKTKAQLTSTLKALGAGPFQQQRVPGSWLNGGFGGRAGRASLWAIRNPCYWEQAGAQARGEEWGRQEGLLSAFHGTSITVSHRSEWPGDPADLVVQRIQTFRIRHNPDYDYDRGWNG